MLKKSFLSGVILACTLFTAVSQVSADSCQPTSGAPSGTVTYNGQAITVTNGTFTLNGVTGSIDNGGYVSYNGYVGCLTNIPGVTGYQVSGQQSVALTPVFTGTVTYGKDSVTVTNGKFTFNGKAGTITSSGSDWVVAYDGLTASIGNINCLTSYRLDGQTTVTTGKAMCSVGGTDLTSWANAHGGLQKNRNASWQEFSPNVSQYQVEDWLVNNPNITPMQVFESMKANRITFLTISLAWHRAGSRGALYDFNFANPPVTTKMIYDAGLLEIPKSRTTDPMSYIFSGDNVREAAIYGLLPIGVRQADICRLDGSVGTDEQISFSQNDLNLARQYRTNGYWGPNNTGNIQWEIQKLGISKARLDYTSTGPNIATANDCKLTVPVTTVTRPATTTVATTTANTCSNLYWFDTTSKACGQKQFCGAYMYQGLQTFATQSQCLSAATTGNTSTTNDNDDDDETVISACVDIPVRIQYLSKDTNTTKYVTLLQDFLHDNNYLTSNATGFFGSGTLKAVKAFQKANGLTQTGSLGPLTRAKIKAVSCDALQSDDAQPISVAPANVNSPVAAGSPSVLGDYIACVDLPTNFHRGAENPNVEMLQSFLMSKGFLNEKPTGFYGDKTVEAVKDYQASRKLPITGMMFDFTRKEIKNESCF
jgi:peptidoglycan hydrolase-like protein with peptidoglycan-binding domain